MYIYIYTLYYTIQYLFNDDTDRNEHDDNNIFLILILTISQKKP